MEEERKKKRREKRGRIFVGRDGVSQFSIF
jgi:hypothetical protein